MGSNRGDKDEVPVHTVKITRPFAVGRFEVTFAEWDAFVAAGGCTHMPIDLGWGRGRRPVVHVSLLDAYQYVAWLSKKTGKGYRLLSEAEWGYAARAGTTTKYAFGDTISKQQAQFNAKKASKVGSVKPSVFGLHVMHGNVWEWVADCWNSSYSGAPEDGSAWTEGYCRKRIFRGGSRYDSAWHLRSANRSWLGSNDRFGIIGFRVARSL